MPISIHLPSISRHRPRSQPVRPSYENKSHNERGEVNPSSNHLEPESAYMPAHHHTVPVSAILRHLIVFHRVVSLPPPRTQHPSPRSPVQITQDRPATSIRLVVVQPVKFAALHCTLRTRVSLHQIPLSFVPAVKTFTRVRSRSSVDGCVQVRCMYVCRGDV